MNPIIIINGKIYRDKYYYNRKRRILFNFPIENIIIHSGDGIESRVIAKDILYKFDAYLKKQTGRGINLKNRLLDYSQYSYTPISHSIKKQFKKWYENNNHQFN